MRVQGRKNLFFDIANRLLPQLNGEAQLLLCRQKTISVLHLNLMRFCARRLNNLLFRLRNGKVAVRERDAGACRELETEILYLIQNHGRCFKPVNPDDILHELAQFPLLHFMVDERIVFGKDGIEEKPANGGFKTCALKTSVLRTSFRRLYPYFRVDAQRAKVIRENGAVRGCKIFALALFSRDILRHPVDAECDVQWLLKDDRLG